MMELFCESKPGKTAFPMQIGNLCGEPNFSPSPFHQGLELWHQIWEGGQKGRPLPKICHASYNDETWDNYTLPKEDPKHIWIT